MASDEKVQKKQDSSLSPVFYILIAFTLLGGALLGYFKWQDAHPAQQVGLTPDAKAYAPNLKLSDVEIKASESYMHQTVVEINGKIGNAGNRPLEVVEIYCIFHDPYGQMVLRKRVSIVGGRTGGLKPGETKTFRLPFDEIPESWNQALPQLVIAGVKFS
ncbi:MAG: FxLYD domain-containing protein [Bryobacteraceae bacterium]